MPDKEETGGANVEAPKKQTYRKKIWDHITKNELANFPLSVYSRIPNFKGSEEAARRLLELEAFKGARVVKINPDKPQEAVRLLALEAGKEILVPIPRLKSGLFLHVKRGTDDGEEELKTIATRQGLQQFGKPLGLESDIKVDLVVLGAVCVDRAGHRIGKGEGFADLEFAVMMKMGAVSSATTIITTVHDCQVVDDLPSEMFEKYDVPVDIIVTPTRTIVVNERLRRPDGIFWELLTPRRVKSMQILQELRRRDEESEGGKEIALKEEDPIEARRGYEGRWFRRTKSKRRTERPLAEVAPNADNEKKDRPRETAGSRLPRRRKLRERKSTEGDRENSLKRDNNHAKENSDGRNEVSESREKPRRRKSVRPRIRSNIDFSLKLSNIKSDVRVRHLKNALLERGVRASDITWHGQRGYCYLHFGKLRNKDTEPDQPIQVDSIVANLQKLKLGENVGEEPEDDENEYIVVEPAKPVTRIEITDVTAV